MKKIIRKLHARRGESLVEILVAILIVAFGCILIATMFSASFSLNNNAKDNDKQFYDAISEMESQQYQEGSKKFDVSITESGKTGGVEVEVNRYGNGGLSSYRKDD